MGLTPIKTTIQTDEIDRDLRVALWNLFHELFLHIDPVHPYMEEDADFGRTYKLLCTEYLRIVVDAIDYHGANVRDHLREIFLTGPWHQVYDVLEFVAQYLENSWVADRFVESANAVLEKELAGFRFVGRLITPITDPQELEAIERALNVPPPFGPVAVHVTEAVAKLSDRKTPDYRNSIKESISAVEALCRILTTQPKATLGDALRAIDSQGAIQIHPALNRAFSALYGWTSDAQGIRHALLDAPDLGFEEAKFMLASCSAFVNFLIAKAAKSGIPR